MPSFGSARVLIRLCAESTSLNARNACARRISPYRLRWSRLCRRSNKRTPNPVSSRAMARDNVGCVTCISAATAVMFSDSVRATNHRNSCKFTA